VGSFKEGVSAETPKKRKNSKQNWKEGGKKNVIASRRIDKRSSFLVHTGPEEISGKKKVKVALKRGDELRNDRHQEKSPSVEMVYARGGGENGGGGREGKSAVTHRGECAGRAVGGPKGNLGLRFPSFLGGRGGELSIGKGGRNMK